MRVRGLKEWQAQRLRWSARLLAASALGSVRPVEKSLLCLVIIQLSCLSALSFLQPHEQVFAEEMGGRRGIAFDRPGTRFVCSQNRDVRPGSVPLFLDLLSEAQFWAAPNNAPYIPVLWFKPSVK